MVADAATSLRRGIAVLQALHSEEALGAGGLGVLRIAELVGEDKSQISRTLKVLHEYGLVDRDSESLAYRIGWGVFALATRAGDTRLLAAGEPIVKELARTLGERVELSVLQGADVLTLLSQSAPQAIQATGWTGRTIPVSRASSGRALLLDHTLEQLRALLDEDSVGPASRAPRTVRELHDRIERARAQGWVRVEEEIEAGLVAAAAPVRDFRGRIVAALEVSGPSFRLGPRLDAAGAAIREGAGRLSAMLAGGADGATRTAR